MDESLGGLASLLSSPEAQGAIQNVLAMLNQPAEEKPSAGAPSENPLSALASLFASAPEAPAQETLPPPAQDAPSAGPGGIPTDQLLRLLPLLQELQKPAHDPRSELIGALRPYVSSRRSGSVDTALQLLQYIRIAEKLRGTSL